ncbi:hypothetical protein D187_006944 [Cystobacter fuscus DSM 2262]|uniref:Response regulatory domain-containing protein n=2 Tax=Cystobacter fuscus TaxID=43 RepID=S9NYB2_CYSF2|nr:hypothetical protein D187_006944 [Cystobacter fuscus DSM 2262]
MSSILLIDDDPDLIEIYTELLEQMGQSVMSAPDGQTGLKLAREHQPDLIITDVCMPHMNGLELCRRLRTDARLRAIPRIIHSSEVNLLLPKGEVFLPKPCEPRSLMALVELLLANARPARGKPPSRKRSAGGSSPPVGTEPQAAPPGAFRSPSSQSPPPALPPTTPEAPDPTPPPIPPSGSAQSSAKN